MVGIATFRKLREMEASLADNDHLMLGQPPAWAIDLMRQVASAHNRPHLPTLYWRRYRKVQYRSSSGLCQSPRMVKRTVITIRQGRCEDDQRSTLLHELAHWLVGVKHGHSPQFYVQAFRLFKDYGDLRCSARRELRYLPDKAREALLQSELEPSFIDQLLIAAGVNVKPEPHLGQVFTLLGPDGRQVVEIFTKVPITDGERAAIEADVRSRYPTSAEPLKFSVEDFSRRGFRRQLAVRRVGEKAG